jgi:hypothetical protein
MRQGLRAVVFVLFVTTIWSSPAIPAEAANCANSFVPGLTALTDLGAGTYQGQQGGLYPGGTNSIPSGHATLGLGQANAIQPLNSSGQPSSSGLIGLIAIGVSNTSDDFGAFIDVATADARVAPNVALVDGAVSGHPIDTWLDPAGVPWGVVDDRLAAAGVAYAQVQAAWIMLPDRNPFPLPFPSEQQAYKDKLATVVRELKVRFPNLRLAYLSSHQYTGYADEHANLEPIAYLHGFGVKWLIEDQINGVGNLNPNPSAGAVVAPWLAWGPYTWANGVGPDGVPGGQPGRSDGLEWACSDFTADGVHPSTTGKAKSAAMLLAHFTSAPTACPWFLADGVACGSAIPALFADIAGSPFASDIIWLAQMGITQGCKPAPGALFCPLGLVTRGEMAAFLVRASGLTAGGTADLFSDDNGSIFETDINKLATAGVTLGCAPGLFCPNGLVTRGEMAAFLSRILNLPNPGNVNLFVDDNGSVFESDIEKIAIAGITLGCKAPPNALFCPSSPVTREQMAAFLHRAYG